MEMKMVVDLAPLAGVKRSGIYALSVPCMKEPKIIKIEKKIYRDLVRDILKMVEILTFLNRLGNE